MSVGSRRCSLLTILWLVFPVVLTLTSCSVSDDFATEPLLNTYQSVWINADWSGGATGPPLTLKAVTPVSSGASLCPATSLILENHSTRFKAFFSFSDEGLVFKNNCTSPANLLVCASAGSGGNFSEFPVCNVDPRTTPLSRLSAINLAAFTNDLSSMRWAETGLNLNLNIFYCGVGDAFAAGVISGANVTDCIQ